MSTSRERADEIVAWLDPVADIRIRGMMGGWLVYGDDVLIGQVNAIDGRGGELFLKPTAAAEELTAHLARRPPYPGAKPAILVPIEQLHDPEWTRAVLAATVSELRGR